MLDRASEMPVLTDTSHESCESIDGPERPERPERFRMFHSFGRNDRDLVESLPFGG